MEISIGQKPNRGMLESSVTLYEQINGFGHSTKVTVFIDESDSRQEISRRTAKSARDFLERCIAALDAEYPQPEGQ